MGLEGLSDFMTVDLLFFKGNCIRVYRPIMKIRGRHVFEAFGRQQESVVYLLQHLSLCLEIGVEQYFQAYIIPNHIASVLCNKYINLISFISSAVSPTSIPIFVMLLQKSY